MSGPFSARNLGLPLGLIALIFGVASAVLMSQAALTHPELAMGALADLLITGPVVFLVFAALRRLPLIVVVPVANIGLELAKLTAPADLQPWIRTAMWVTYPLMALVIVRVVALAAMQLRAAYPAVAGIPDLRDRIGAWLDRAIGAAPSSAMIASDIAFLRYAIHPPRAVHQGPGRFSGHRDSGLIPLLWAFAAVVVLETVVLHVLVHLLAPVLAWLLTALSLYSLLTLVGHIRALPRRDSTLEDRGITLRAGLFGQCHIPYDQIAEVTPLAMGSEIPDDSWQLGLLGGMEPRNLLLRLHRPVAVRITHGLTRTARHIALHADDPAGFSRAVLDMRDRQLR